MHLQSGFVAQVDPAVADAVYELLDEVDEEETAAEENFSHRDSVKVVARALNALTDLETKPCR